MPLASCMFVGTNLLLNRIGFAMRWPVTTLMLVVTLFGGGFPAVEKMCLDIFRSLILVK